MRHVLKQSGVAGLFLGVRSSILNVLLPFGEDYYLFLCAIHLLIGWTLTAVKQAKSFVLFRVLLITGVVL